MVQRWIVHPASADPCEPSRSYAFVADRTADGRPIRMLTIVDDFSPVCLAIHAAKRLVGENVLERSSELFVQRGVRKHSRSDNGSEITAKSVWE